MQSGTNFILILLIQVYFFGTSITVKGTNAAGNAVNRKMLFDSNTNTGPTLNGKTISFDVSDMVNISSIVVYFTGAGWTVNLSFSNIYLQ